MKSIKRPTYQELEKQIIELERLPKERFLKNSKQYRELFKNMTEMFQIIELIYDDNETVIDYYFRDVNPALEKFVAKNRNQLIGARAKELFGDIEDYWLQTYKKVSKTEKAINLEKYDVKNEIHFKICAWKIEENKIAILFNDITKRKLAEKKLIKVKEIAKKKEENLNKIDRITHTGSLHLNLATKKIRWSKEVFKMFDLAPELSAPLYSEHQKLFTPESWEILSNELAKISKTGIPNELELRIVRSDGSNGWIWFRGEAEIGKDYKTIGIWGAVQDISKRKEKENKINNLGKLNQTILNHAQEGIYAIDLNENTIFINPAASKMIGWELSEILHKNYHDILHHSHADGTRYDKNDCPVCATYKNDKIHHVNNEVFWRKDGSSFPVEYISSPIKNNKGKITGAVITFNDITSRSETIVELVVANKELAFENLEKENRAAALVITNNKITYENKLKAKRAAKVLLKKTDKELNEAQKLARVGSWLFNISSQKSEWSEESFNIWGFDLLKDAPGYDITTKRIQPDDLELFNSSVDKAIRIGTPYDIEFRISIPNGPEKVLRSICKPIFGDNGKVISLTGTNQDITLQKIFEEAQIKHQRLKAIGEMSASIAHDFNNALQQMMGNLEIIKIQQELSNTTLERLNSISTIIESAAGRVTALQKFGDTEHADGKNRAINFNILIQESLKESRPLWKDGMEKEGLSIQVKTYFKEIPKITCNRGELKSAIYNLIKNSIEALPKGGDLIIKTGIKKEGVFATFTDTGIGMDKETKSKIFQPFFSTKGFQLGRGLGMSGVYRIVKRYKGEIAVIDSEINKGTTIEIVFPIQL